VQQLDRRSKRTQAALLKAFAQLMLSEGYDAVTVERVCAEADVGRSTFYLHFAGKEGILRQSLAGPSSHLVALLEPDAGPEALQPILEHFHQQRKKNWMCFTHPVRAMWVKRLGELIEPKLAVRARAIRARPILPLAIVGQQIAESQLALIANWLTAHPTTSTLTIAEALIAATRGMMAALLRSDHRALLAKRPSAS
jgi:AcrR family transcriptional regulator